MAADRSALAQVLDVAEQALVAEARGGPEPPLPPGADPAATAALAAAARAAIASKFLAVGTPRSIGLVGAGAIAPLLLEAHRAIGLAPREVRCADVDPAAAARLAGELGARAAAIEEAFACDVVLVSSQEAAATLDPAWLRRGTHVNTLGLWIATYVLAGHKIVIGHSGLAIPTGTHIYATLGAIAAGLVDGRELDEITAFLDDGHPAVERAVARWALTAPDVPHLRPLPDLQS